MDWRASRRYQDAIDSAGANDLLLVKPGVYNEMVVMWKPLQLQGWGEGSTTINAVKSPSNKLEDLARPGRRAHRR